MNLARNVTRRILIMTVLVSFAQFSLISDTGFASIADSRTITPEFQESRSREADQRKIRRMLENKIIAKRLDRYGLSDEQVHAKIESMTDEQVHQLASLADRIPAGGDASAAALIVIITIAVAIVITLLIVMLNRKA